MRIHSVNQLQLPAPPPFNFLFSGDSVRRVAEHFVIHQAGEIVFGSKTGPDLVLMLEHPLRQIAGPPVYNT